MDAKMDKSTNFSSVSLPKPLIGKIKKRIEGTGFTSVSSYVTYVLREVITDSAEEKSSEAFTKEDEEKVRNRLRALGYME